MKIPQVKTSSAPKKPKQGAQLPELGIGMDGSKPRFTSRPFRRFNLQRAMAAKLRGFMNQGLLKGR